MIKVAKHINECGESVSVIMAPNRATVETDVQNGCYLIYYDQCREFLKDLYNETDEEADKYTNEEVWTRYKHVIGLMQGHKRIVKEYYTA